MQWSKEQIEKFAEINKQVQKLAVTDEDFRAELLKTPKTALEKIAGEKLPEDFNIRVIEDKVDSFKIIDHHPDYTSTLLLPPMKQGELCDDALEGVAGGVGINYEVVTVGLDGFEVGGGNNADPNKCCCCLPCCFNIWC